MKRPTVFRIGVERGSDGYSAAWCFDLPGCYVLVPPGTDLIDRAGVAILEYSAWSHNRAAELLTIDPEHIEIAQAVDTGADLRSAGTSAFFMHDGEPPSPREFPLWADAHDRAVDELRELALSLPRPLLDHRLDMEGRTLLGTVHDAATTERWFAARLAAGGRELAGVGLDPQLKELQEAHRWLQQVVCDVQPGLRVRHAAATQLGTEEWSVRKVMRRSVQNLRYRYWELKRAISTLWLG